MLPAQPRRIAQDNSLDCQSLIAPSVLAPNLAISRLFADTLLPVRGIIIPFVSNGQIYRPSERSSAWAKTYRAAVTQNAHRDQPCNPRDPPRNPRDPPYDPRDPPCNPPVDWFGVLRSLHAPKSIVFVPQARQSLVRAGLANCQQCCHAHAA